MRFTVVQRIKEILGFAGPTCREMRETMTQARQTIDEKHPIVIQKIRSRVQRRSTSDSSTTQEIPA